MLYYLGLRQGEVPGLMWGDLSFTENQVHIRRDLDYACACVLDGSLKTETADRYVPIPPEQKGEDGDPARQRHQPADQIGGWQLFRHPRRGAPSPGVAPGLSDVHLLDDPLPGWKSVAPDRPLRGRTLYLAPGREF